MPDPYLLNRRSFVQVLAATGLPAFGLPDYVADRVPIRTENTTSRFQLCIFSKHLHWVPIADLGRVAADLGFSGIDLTVRKGGHVDPVQVRTELPRAVESIRKAGLDVPMMATDITDAAHPLTAPILKTASELGIRYYRMGYVRYDAAQAIPENLRRIQAQFEQLAALNRQFNIHGAYQNHTGTNFGAAVWDLWEVVKTMDPRWSGCQYDIKHATAEGGMSWVNGLNALKTHIRCLDIKDFLWAKTNGKWYTQVVPLGEGMVDYPAYLKLLKQYDIRGPVSLHYEYPLGGSETGKTTLSIPKETVLAAMQRDLQTLKRWLTDAQLD